jgi:DNA-binding NarL/FixJ family response regulator
VVIADDSVLLREGIAQLLVRHDFDVVATVGDIDDLLLAVDALGPDVAVIDIRMPPTFTDEGIAAAISIRASHPGVGVLVLSQHLETTWAIRLLENGAAGVGYLLKDRVSRIEEFTEAIERVAAGGSVIDPDVVQRLVGKQRASDPLAVLTAREQDVLQLMAEGRSNRAIGTALYMGTKTVETHVRSILMKLAISESPTDNRRVLAVLAYLRGS